MGVVSCCASSKPSAMTQKTDLPTWMPHSLTKPACFLASGQSKAVPKALHKARRYQSAVDMQDIQSTGRG